MSGSRNVARAGVLAIAILGTTAMASTRDEILAALDTLNAAYSRGASTAELTELLYVPEVVIVGEGEKTPKQGLQGGAAEVDAFVRSLGHEGIKSCKAKLVGPEVSSAETFASFVSFHCDAQPPGQPQPIEARLLWVWKKAPHGWRIALEQWGMGKY